MFMCLLILKKAYAKPPEFFLEIFKNANQRYMVETYREQCTKEMFFFFLICFLCILCDCQIDRSMTKRENRLKNFKKKKNNYNSELNKIKRAMKKQTKIIMN